jgi:hypothetical protein
MLAPFAHQQSPKRAAGGPEKKRAILQGVALLAFLKVDTKRWRNLASTNPELDSDQKL